MKACPLTPPKGWNSWDVYGASVTEAETKRNARVMADKLKPLGWEYIIVDIQWYEPTATSAIYNKFANLCMDEFSRLMPAVNRFPSSEGGKGFKPLADYIHSLGLKFGIHIMRGIPREAVHRKMPIKGTNITADKIATNTICPWNSDMYGLNTQLPEAQLYIDSLIELYASWDVDFLKIDDIADSKIYPKAHLSEIKAYHKAIEKVDREMVISLSPGPAHIEDGSFLQQHANMWRLTDDFWDEWPLVLEMFDKCNQWSPFIKKGNWPDCDMLPLGHIGIRSGERGMPDRMTRLSQEQQKTLMTLWYIFQSPLMFGGEMADLDDWTLSLLNNKPLNEMHALLNAQRQVYRDDTWVLWTAESAEAEYIAIFNVSDVEATPGESLITEYFTGDNYRGLWQNETYEDLKATFKAHDCMIFKVGG